MSMNRDLFLRNFLDKDIETSPIRKGFGEGLKLAGELNENVVAACADLTESTQTHIFRDAFPERFFEIGIAEQNLVTVGSGLAAMGKIPFVSSYAAFSPGRNWEQIKTTVALNNVPVKIIGAHAGLYTGPDGATHQMLEDISLMRVMPNMVVICPGDSMEAKKATLAMAKDSRPNYLRLSREATPILTTEETPFEIGKAYTYVIGSELTIISTGTMTYQSLLATSILKQDGINVELIHVPTIKPLDAVTILSSVRKTKAVITVEEGQINGGLGGAIAELLSENIPVPMKRIGVKDTFGQSGKPSELIEHYGLSPKHIALAAHELLANIGRE